MSGEIKREEFDKYIINVVSIHRKIMLTLFDLELTKNEELRNWIEQIKNSTEIDKTFFFFEGIIDFKSMILLLDKFNSKGKIKLIIDVKKEKECKILKNALKNSTKLRNDLWHNCIEYNNPNNKQNNCNQYSLLNNFNKQYQKYKYNQYNQQNNNNQNNIDYNIDYNHQYNQQYNNQSNANFCLKYLP